MSNAPSSGQSPSNMLSWQSAKMQSRLAKRQAADRRFKALGLAAVCLSAGFVILLLVTVAWRGVPAFFQTELALDVTFDPAVIGAAPATAQTPEGKSAIIYANYNQLIGEAMNARFPSVTAEQDQRMLRRLVSAGARAQLRKALLKNPEWIGTRQRVWLYASDDADHYLRGKLDPKQIGAGSRLPQKATKWLDTLKREDATRLSFHALFFLRGDSREPELAGIWGAVVGSFLTLAVTAIIAFPVGVASAIYLEEFAPKNRFIDIIEININNLAAIPSIIFGLLGLAVLLNVFNLPRSSPLVGGITLALMTLPTIIIASRAAIQAVPQSLRSAAMALGASPMQVVFHHVVPASLPGILSGTIIGMAQALGETAPLLMIGMVAFIVDVPGSFTDAATTLPVQIFLWSDSPERAFMEKTSAAILVLLGFLFAMNAVAVYLRNKFETRW